MIHLLRRTFRAPFSKKKRVRQLQDSKISLSMETAAPQPPPEVPQISYQELKVSLSNLGWETMGFDKLCALPASTINAIEVQIKKDKFNVDDGEFYEFGSGLAGSNIEKMAKLNTYYQRIMALITNDHLAYDELKEQRESPKRFLGEMYVYDLPKDKQLQAVISYFINNLQFPNLLEAEAEPTLVKRLLMMKRELMIQGVKLESMKSRKEVRKSEIKLKRQKKMMQIEREDEDAEVTMFNEENEDGFQGDELDQVDREMKLNNRLNMIMQEVGRYSNQFNIKEVLGFQYEFWVDVKHNRAKNGQPQDYIIEERLIDNPNETILLSKHPKIPVKYIVHKRKRKGYTMHFCIKAELLVTINDKHRRRVKVEWKGPSNKPSDEPTDFRVIDYENIMNGNPTIRSVFQF